MNFLWRGISKIQRSSTEEPETEPESEQVVLLHSILEELKIINIQLSLMTDAEIKHTEVE